MADPYDKYYQFLIIHHENYPVIPAADTKKVTFALKLFHIRGAGLDSEPDDSLPNLFSVGLGKLCELARCRRKD